MLYFLHKMWFSKKLQSSCDTCKKKFQEDEVIIIKVPELIYFCIECAEKKPDNNVYKDWWLCTTYWDWCYIEQTPLPPKKD
jgi:hypothetical protein